MTRNKQLKLLKKQQYDAVGNSGKYEVPLL